MKLHPLFGASLSDLCKEINGRNQQQSEFIQFWITVSKTVREMQNKSKILVYKWQKDNKRRKEAAVVEYVQKG